MRRRQLLSLPRDAEIRQKPTFSRTLCNRGGDEMREYESESKTFETLHTFIQLRIDIEYQIERKKISDCVFGTKIIMPPIPKNESS